MAFFEQRMDTGLMYGARGGPVFNTARAYAGNGRRITNKNWTAALHRYDVSHCVRKESDFEYIRSFFYVVAGAYDGFRFKDWQDFRCAAAESGVTEVSAGVYQLTKRYTAGARTYVRTIQKPIEGAQIYRTRSSVTTNITGSSTLDTTTGRVTVTGHVSGDTYTWAGEFDVPVAFLADEFQPEIINNTGSEFLVASGSIMLEEIRL